MQPIDIDTLIRGAHKVELMARGARTHNDLADAVRRLAKVAEQLAIALKEREQPQRQR